MRKEIDAEDVDRAAVMNPVARLEMFAPTGEEWSSAGIGTCLPVELCIRPRSLRAAGDAQKSVAFWMSFGFLKTGVPYGPCDRPPGNTKGRERKIRPGLLA